MFEVQPNLTLREIVCNIPGLPARFWDEGDIWVGNERIPVAMWDHVRPKQTAALKLTLNHAGGGGDGKGKNILAVLASVLLLVATVGIGAGGLAALGFGSSFAAGTFGAQAAAALVGLGGQLLISALFPPPVPKTGSETSNEIERASINDNILAKGQSVPRVAGTVKVAPPLLVQPHSYLIGEDEYAEAVYALAGPHIISDLKVKGVPIEDVPQVEYVIDEGRPGVTRTNLFTQWGKADSHNLVLSNHQIRGTQTGYTSNEMVRQDDPSKSIPQWHRVRTRKGPDEFKIRLVLSGLFDVDIPDKRQIVHFRLRIRKLGDVAWKNLPQLIYRAKSQGTFRKEITLMFYKLTHDVVEDATDKNDFMDIVDTVAAVQREHLNTHITDPYQWQADAGTVRGRKTKEGVSLYLDDAYFNDGDASYEVEIKRSIMLEIDDYYGEIPRNSITTSQHYNTTSGVDASVNWVIDPFDTYLNVTQVTFTGGSYYNEFIVYGGTWIQYEGEDNNSDVITLDTTTTIYYGEPVVPEANIATIQVRVKNYDFSQLTCLASGLVPVWDGVDWSGLEATSNPANHLRELYADTLGLAVKRYPPEFIDNDVLIEWRDACDINGWEINTILEGSWGDAEAMICSCGYARPVINTHAGITYHHDTSGETGKQAFTPMNTRDMSFTIAYSEKPVGFRIEFYNEDNDYEQDEIIVYDPYTNSDATDLEAISYPGITNVDKVVERALFDFEQALKAVRYSFTTGIEHIASSQGDLVLLSHHMLQNHVDYFTVKKVIGLNKFQIDRSVDYITPDGFFDITNLFEHEDVFQAGQEVGLITRSPIGNGDDDPTIIVHDVVSFDSSDNTFVVEDASMLRAGDLVIIGPLTTLTKRCIILDVEPQDQMTAKITCMDE